MLASHDHLTPKHYQPIFTYIRIRKLSIVIVIIDSQISLNFELGSFFQKFTPIIFVDY